MMDKEQLRHMFPRASKSFIEANPHLAEFVQRGATAQAAVDSIIAGSQPHGKLRGAPKPNKTEAEFGDRILAPQKARGEILRYEFQGITLRWADMRYTPDWFVVFLAGNTPYVFPKFRCIEIKGPHIHYEQQAVARFKGARGAWQEIEFQMWQRVKGSWNQLA
jgi:hypothetical protein